MRISKLMPVLKWQDYFQDLKGREENPVALKIIIMTEMDTIYISNFDTCENNFLWNVLTLYEIIASNINWVPKQFMKEFFIVFKYIAIISLKDLLMLFCYKSESRRNINN